MNEHDGEARRAAGAIVVVRDADEADLPAIQRIYAYYVLHGLATFEEVPPSVDDLRERRAAIVGRGLPYLVAEIGGEVVGYSYASAYRPRPAYRHTVEDSVYVLDGRAGQGIGRALLTALIARCEGRDSDEGLEGRGSDAGPRGEEGQAGWDGGALPEGRTGGEGVVWRQMIAVIGDSANVASIALHERLGFRPTGTLHAVGFKLGRWVDTVLMQRDLGAGSATLPTGAKRLAPGRPFGEGAVRGEALTSDDEPAADEGAARGVGIAPGNGLARGEGIVSSDGAPPGGGIVSSDGAALSEGVVPGDHRS